MLHGMPPPSQASVNLKVKKESRGQHLLSRCFVYGSPSSRKTGGARNFGSVRFRISNSLPNQLKIRGCAGSQTEYQFTLEQHVWSTHEATNMLPVPGGEVPAQRQQGALNKDHPR